LFYARELVAWPFCGPLQAIGDFLDALLKCNIQGSSSIAISVGLGLLSL